ncbi:hypothetical protein HBH56_134220 [Parastagonospora nodorum]|uniref:F-box domain-containing protein n=1 Tax=Phaeosphaeria nodorum (strain SN15 / ATCC MYA-4574 / FGSC 10173) TaxID=321614 RepID=A0A7U2FCE6_PHANO|nr:hypothetical protein HBH56_134220 [Parastagonospora nodorum]QRD02687.1 hypothetical protein JI435_114240 [Parastagonospora nodorum SN15]KAH3927168.1 hypothetical protein HBH54_159070 [Parastagonospora nodorum]KAH3949282.1 hypothetical protein HBH53_089280 [Parastagonospora nodorum]KAH4119993.1 hypothetical protein HBH47_118330 [Parastagonospora nodorum]
MSLEEYQELGRRYYKLKEYKNAVEAFTNGIEIMPTLSLFDHRAAAYDRLEDYNAAVKDGREMIKINKQDVKGYLRTASILEKMEKLETALGIYKYGMKNVAVTDKYFKLLQQLHDKTTRKLSPAKSVDPLTILPVELAEIVLEYMTFRQLVNCMRVSRGWRDYVANLPRLWMHLDLSGARRPVPRKFVDKAVRRSENRLTRVTIHRFEHIDILKNVAVACKNLTDLEFISLPHAMSSTFIDIVQCAPNLSKLVIYPQISMDTLTQIMQTRPTLRHVDFHEVQSSRHSALWNDPFSSLEHITLHFPGVLLPTTPVMLTNLFTSTPNLKYLDLVANRIHNATFLDGLHKLPLETLILKTVHTNFSTLPSTLQKFSLNYTVDSDLVPADTPGLLRSRLQDLTHLSLFEVNNVNADRIEELLDLYTDEDAQLHTLQGAAPLQSLTFRGLPSDDNVGFFNKKTNSLFARSPRVLTPALQHLDLAKQAVGDDDVEHLLEHEVTGLRSVDFSYSYITGASIKMLVDKLPGLKSIYADNCSRISGRDAIEYARRKGVFVSCTMGEGKGGKKIRYG